MSLPLIVRANSCFGEGDVVGRGRPAALLADSFQELYDLAQASEIQQMRGIRPERRCRRTGVVGQVHGDGGVGAIGQPHDQVRIRPPANPHDRHLLPVEGVIRMCDSHRFRSWLGRLGSVLWGCRPF
jgi:hypothetical protein